MGLDGYIALSIAVISDYRVIAITVATFLLWGVLRYVGMVYGRRRKPRSAPRPSAPKKAASRPQRKRGPPAAKGGDTDEEGAE